MANDEPTVWIVDDDEQARRSVSALVRSMGLGAEAFASAEEFLDAYREDRPGCLVTDVRMVGMSGLELQDMLNERNVLLPVIVLTAYARTSLTVRAVKSGAFTVLEKPYDEDDLWDAIRSALADDAESRAKHARRRELQRRIGRLTPAEREVMDMVVRGKPNKNIARLLGVSIRTVESRRQEIFSKMEADSVAKLVRLVIDAGMEP